MKLLITFLSILIILPLANAVTIDMKNIYSQSETILIKISGTFSNTISPENIYFYRGHVRIPILYDVTKLGNDYYIYAIAPETENNYTFRITNVLYKDGTHLIQGDLEKNFSVTASKASFHILPGFLITNKDFLIKIENTGQDTTEISIDSVFNVSSTKLTLESGGYKQFPFSIPQNLNVSLYTINFSSSKNQYSIPVLLTESTITQPKHKELLFSPPLLNISLEKNTNKTFIIYINNIGEENLSNVTLSISENIKGYISLDTNITEEIPTRSNVKIRIFVIPSKEGVFNGKIESKIENLSITLPILLSVYNLGISNQSINISNNISTKETYEEEKSCKDYNGVFCASNEKCLCNEQVLANGKCEENLLEGKCCRGQCVLIQTQQTSSTKYVGWSLLILVILLLAFFLKKFFKK